MRTKSTIQVSIASTLLASLALIALCSGCESGYTYRGPIVNNNFQSGSASMRNTVPTPAIDESKPPKHYSDGQAIPGVGWAIGDVYILPDGACYGGEGSCGILWSSGSRMIFSSPFARFPLVRPGSPATRSTEVQKQMEDQSAIVARLQARRANEIATLPPQANLTKDSSQSPSATQAKGFWNDKDAPGIVTKIENWNYSGIYYPVTDGVAKATKVSVFGVTAMATSNGGDSLHWWGFKVQKVTLENDPNHQLPFEIENESTGLNANQPIIVLEGKYRLVPLVSSVYNILFRQRQ